jgi:hypothetical protein
MDKINNKRLIKYLEKINLNGLANKIVIKTENGMTKVRNNDDNGDLIIECKDKTLLFDEGETVGIYDVQQILKFLKMFDTAEINYGFIKTEAGKNDRIKFGNKDTKVEFILADDTNITEPIKLKKEPDIHFKFKIDSVLSKNIIKALDTTNAKTFYIVNKKGLILNIGEYGKGTKDHNIKIKIENFESPVETVNEYIAFKSNYIRNILNVNDTVTVSVAMDGLIIFENIEDNIKSVYYQRGLKGKELDND